MHGPGAGKLERARLIVCGETNRISGAHVRHHLTIAG